MDSEESVENQFAKLHPRFPTHSKIAIVGAGPGGLSAAYALCKLGYTHVTVIEKNNSVGGMCESAEIEGRIYDLGGQLVAESTAPTIFHLAKQIGAEIEEMDRDKFSVIDSSSGKYTDMIAENDHVSMVSLTLKLQDETQASNRIGVHAVSDKASDLTLTFLKQHGIKTVPKSVAYSYTASGYGFVQDMPYAYIHEFTRTFLAEKIQRFKGGYVSVWQKINERLPIKVCCNTEVLAVRRNSVGISIDVRDQNGEKQVIKYDKIIISGSFPFKNAKSYRSPPSQTTGSGVANEPMDMSELEKELFSKVQTIDYYTTIMKLKGLEHIPMGFYYFGEFMEDPATIGHPVAMQRFYADTNIFLFWSYGNSADIKGKEVTEFAINIVEKMGGEVEEVVLQRQFKYFPHVNNQDIKDGFYDKLELELQGQNDTYFVGGLVAFELTERNASYAMALVCKHFANNSPLPNLPYVKSLFPLQSSREAWIPKQLDELPGMEFPDIASLDGFLRHWGTHSVTEKKTLYTWINEKGEVVGQRTYKELHVNASHIASRLLTSRKPNIKPGDRVLLVYLPGLDFIDAFFGCLRARVIPVPVIPPDPSHKSGQAFCHIENITKACNPVVILSTFSYHMTVRAISTKNMLLLARQGENSSCWRSLPWLHTETWTKISKLSMPFKGIVEKSEPLPLPLPMPLPSALCFLQFTSGSTGEAKGVMITHGGLIHNVKLMRKRYKSTSRTVLVSWLPQYHDMGLIGGLFTSMVSGGSAILFSPLTFVKNPLLWLQTMSNYRATHSAGPNFAFELIVRRLESSRGKAQNLDLSSLVFLMIAAEPVRPRTLKRFIELTRCWGLSQEVMAPGYGLAENCVYVSSAFGEGKPIFLDSEGRVCCGYVDQNDTDVDIRIVDAEMGIEHEEQGKEGEIWVHSPSAGIGYWGMEEMSQKTFGNVLQKCPGKKYTRTGDLGYIIDRKLFITGRIKDLIIVAGRNVYPSDVERTVESSSDLLRSGCCAVVGVPEEILTAKGISVPESCDQVGLAVIVEVRDDKPLPMKVIERIQARVGEEHGISISCVVPIKPRTISKTTSGKVKRFDCLKQFIDDKLNVIKESSINKRSLTKSMEKVSQPQVTRNLLSTNSNISRTEIINFLKELLCEQSGIQTGKISTTESFVSYGIDSIGVVRASHKLSAFLGVQVGAIDIFTATCIEDLADFVESLIGKYQPQSETTSSHFIETKTNRAKICLEISLAQKLTIWLFQLLALALVSFLLIFPAYLSVSAFTTLISASHALRDETTWFMYFITLAFAPLAWMLCIWSTCLCIASFKNSVLQPNYALTPEISIWSLDFVKWWAFYKAQEISSKILAVHLRGTVFINHWFEMLGAKIGSSVLLDTIDITDPSLVSVGEGTVIAEGALLQSHEVKNGVLSLSPIRIGRFSYIGPYAVVLKGSKVKDGAEVQALQTCEQSTISKNVKADNNEKHKMSPETTKRTREKHESLCHFLGIYVVALLSSLTASIVYFIYLGVLQQSPSIKHFEFFCIVGAFHWFPYTIVAYAIMFNTVPSHPINFAISIAIAYLAHGLILSILTCSLAHVLSKIQASSQKTLRTWLRHHIIIACHLRFIKFLPGTETLCTYFRLLNAKIGQHCSIRVINPISDPQLIAIHDGVHLGDYSHIIPGFYTSSGFVSGRIQIQENSVVGSQSLVLPGSVVEKDVILGAVSVAPMNSVLQKGGVFVGSQTPVMVKNITHVWDERLEETDVRYKKVLANLAANFAATTLKVGTRSVHRIGAAGKGWLRLYNDLPGLPDHKLFSPGKNYPIIIRHSNFLSSDDDARVDPRAAAIRIISENSDMTPLLDLTLQTGKAFHARTIADLATWLMSGSAAREELVKHAPHVREALWDACRRPDSYSELHYYSNISRLFRFESGHEMYVKFKLRPFDNRIGEDSGKVEPFGILPPETGPFSRHENDTRPLLFLAEDFERRVKSPERIRYVLQLQMHSVPKDESTRETALDVTKPWDETEFPYIQVGEVTIDQVLTKQETEELEFNPYIRCHEVDIIRATSCSESASIDHGRSIVYEICQHLRNKKPLPEAWRKLLEQSNVKMDLSGCPVAAAFETNNDRKVTLQRPWYTTLWMMSVQPFLQVFLPYFLVGLVVFAPLDWVLYMKETKKLKLHCLLPLFWVCTGLLAGLVCVLSRWILVRKKEQGQTVHIWSRGIFLDTIWQAIRILTEEYFMGITGGSFLCGLYLKLMGSEVAWDQGVYVDGMGAVLNPEMVSIEKHGCVGREALLFGHIYEGEGGKVKYGKITIEEGGFVGSRAVAMPGVIVETEGSLGTLSLAMKEEIVK